MAEAITSAQRGFMDFSPVGRDNDANKENDHPVLSLIQFSKPPFVTFGTVKLGTSKSAVLRIENPIEDVEAEVAVDKIPSSKGFSVDHNTFTIQPESLFVLTITWTPTEEGGFRELITFSANGVLKHQAVLLGRAEAPKKKKKSLWDAIKNKREGGQTRMRKKTTPPLKMVTNKTFQVSRNPQYKREKPRSPLALLNEGKVVRERSPMKHGSKPGEQKVLNSKQNHPSMGICQIQKNSPVVLLVPASNIMDSSNTSASPNTEKPENKELIKVFNKTLSPIGTPERFKKLMPRIQSDSSDPASGESTGDYTVPSLKDALDLIGSDLTSPTSSSCEFSDSLESKSEKHSCNSDKDAFKATPDSPELLESNQPRLTFFVSKKVVSGDAKVVEKVKKASFTSVTVTKGKAPAEVNSPCGRKMKKSRRRLLEKTLELSDGSSQSDSGPGTPSLPVIDTDTGAVLSVDGHQVPEVMSSSPKLKPDSSPAPITFPVSSPLPLAPFRFTFSASSPPPSVPAPTTFTITSPPPSTPAPTTFTITSSPTTGSLSSESEQGPSVSAQPSAQEDWFPVQLVGKSKKRKSEEHLKDDGKIEDSENHERVKRNRVVVGKPDSLRSIQKKSVSQRAERSTKSVTSSLRKTRPVVSIQAKQPRSRIISQGSSSVKASGSKSVKMAKVVAVAQSKLTFVKTKQTALPRHPMPFAAKNMFYDERWIEKQERGFTWWINYVLTPDDFKVNTEVAKASAMSLAMGGDDKFNVPKAPTKEEMSFSTYTAKRKLNRLRRSACQLFTSEAMVKAIQRLELEVEARRLLVRKDRHLWKDIGERKKVLNWLLSYNPLWLRIGLETIFGELISLESNSDILGLAMFILQRLLWNPDIAAEYRHARVPHLYKDGHEEALSRFTLKKLLLLVCFLDRAKESRLIEHDPCLFCLDAEFKASKDLLLAFSRDFLSGEGILPRHLSYLGLPVSHSQKPLDEFSFAVKNLSVDLKCGIRLVRVMELLIQDWSLSAKLRLPAISRLQKVHNVDLALQVLTRKGIDLKDEHGTAIDSRDIVDGHREKTLNLLWKILFAFHVEVILDEDQLREEICFLKRTLRTKRRLASVGADLGIQPSPAKTQVSYEHTSTKITLLMDWVRAVNDFYNLKVENFTVSFSDGRVLCYLIHRYHPGLLPEASISLRTTQTVECSPRGRLELNSSASESDCSFDAAPTALNDPDCPSLVFKELLENEKNNFRLVNTAVSFLGGVPAMINPADMSNTIPSEKVVMSYLSFLCARLLDLRNETRAARVIQAAWRRHKLKKDLKFYEERNKAAIKIQLVVRRFIQKRRAERQNRAAVIIQSVWRGYLSRNWLRLEKEARIRASQNKAATVIQAQWRMFSTLRAYQRLRYYTITVQAQWRMRRAATAYEKIYWAATVIQKYSRAWALSRRDRERYLLLKTSAVKLQRAFRRWKAQKRQRENCAARVIQAAFKKWYKQKMARRSAAAVRIQAWYRMQLHFHQYSKIKRSAVLIQAHFRGHEQRRHFEMLKLQHNSAVVIQRAFRGHAVKKQFVRLRCAAVVIQRRLRASVRRDVEREMFVQTKRAAVAIQAAYRGRAARELLRKQHRAATVIQAAFRKHSAQKHYLTLRKAAAVIQQRYRATTLARKVKKEYDAVRRAALVLQANWRGRTDRKKVETWHRSATLIQTSYRRHKAQTEYRSIKAAAVVIQHHYKAFLIGKEMRNTFLQKRTAFITLQAAFRGMRVRTELRQKHQAATVIQSVVRMFLCRKRYVLHQSAAIIIQCRYRALLLCREQQSEFRKLKQATITIQAVFRGFTVRKELKKRDDAAVAIQAHFRMYRIRMAYLATRCATMIIQERYRAKVRRDKQMQAYRTTRAAAVVLQAAYRGHKARRKMADLHQAARIIQRKFLAIQARRQFLAIRAAALVCQQRYRAVTLARKVQLDYVSKRRAVVRLQAAYRGYAVRRQLHIRQMAAVTIQSHFRKHQQRTSYEKLRWACDVLQTRYRANKQMRAEVQALSAKKNAAVVLQAAYHGIKSRRVLKEKHQAASVIQRAFRAHRERKNYLTLKSSVLCVQRRYRATVATNKQRTQYKQLQKATITLQAAYRGLHVRKDVAGWHQAATVIQSAFRRHREQVKFQAMRLSAMILQRRYRALLLQRQDRENFLKIKRSAVVLQAAFRGRHVRMEVAKMHRAAAVIQANFRRYKQQRAFRRQRWAAGVLQQRFRAQRQKHLEVKRYQEVRKAAIIFQAAYRGMKSRQLSKQKHQAATVIQSAFRRHREQVKFQAMRLSAMIIQRRYRALLLQRQDRENFLKIKRSVVVLQAAFRGRHVRMEISKMHRAAAVIQASFRGHKQQSAFRQQRWAACILQQRFRAQRQKHLEVKRYQEVRKAAIIFQAAYRGMKSRQIIKQRQQAASVIQRTYKAHCEHRKYLTLKSSVLTIQKRYRATVTAKKQMQQFQTIRNAAIFLQAAYRGRQVRKDVAGWHQAATVIQSAFIRHREQVKFQAMRLSAMIIQRRYRALLLQRQDRENFLKIKRSVVVLQAAFRGRHVRMEVAKMHRAAAVIQSNFRRYKQQRAFRRQRWAAGVLQQRFRAQRQKHLEVKRYQEVRKAAIIFQAAYRRMKSRQLSKQKHQAASVIQRAFRAHCERKNYLTLKSSVLCVQRRYRATVATNKQRKQYKQLQKATITLQAAYRGLHVRKEVAGWHQAATVIQSAFRRHREQVKFQAMRLSAMIIQRRYRALLLQRQDRENFQKIKRSVVVLQAAFRGRHVRMEVAKMHRAAAVIQASFRLYKQQRAFRRQRWAAFILQQRFRAQRQKRLAVKRYQEVRKAAIIFQAAYRGMKSRQLSKQKHQAASVIQRAFRAHCERKNYLTLKSSVLCVQRRYRATVATNKQRTQYKQLQKATITLQAAYRGLHVRKDVAGWHQAATVIQSAFRRHREQVKFQAMRLSAMILQRRYRALLLQRQDRENFLKIKLSAAVLQAAFRGHHVRMEVAKMHRAAAVIQSNFRRYKQQLAFRRQLWAASVLQQRFRAQKHKRREVKHYQEVRKSTIVLQAAYRGMKSRQLLRLGHQAASVIQRAFRTHCEQQQYLKLKASVLIIQQKYRATIRGRAERDHYLRQKQAAITLQRCCRAWSARQQVLKAAQAERRLRFTSAVFHHLSAIKIQQALRAHWALESAKRQIDSVITIQRWVRARQQRRRFLEDRRKVIMVQRAVKSWLARRHQAASVIQLAARKFLLIRRQKRVQQGIVKAQALWRGHHSRKLNDNTKIVKLRHRLWKASVDVREEDKLCNKTTSALEYLLRHKHFSYILEALKNLETTTRLSPECCERLVESGAMNVIFTLISFCNRSVPCMDIITLSIQILLNLSKYHKTVEAVYAVNNSVETLLDLLQRYREKAGDKVAEKGGSIFTKACFLLALLLQDPHRAEEVKKIPHAVDRLCSIYKLTARKHKLDAERSIMKLKMNASVNGSFLATPRKSRPVPKFSPDWVLTKNNLKEIVHPLRAIQMVADTLSIV